MYKPYEPDSRGQMMLNSIWELCRRLDDFDFRISEIECRLNVLPRQERVVFDEPGEDDLF